MMILIIGGSGSGKSSYGEQTAVSLSAGKGFKKYYIAAMKIFDGEGQKKAERHRALRSGKGFITIEQPVDFFRVLEKMEEGNRTLLLECISNLAANEMFSGEVPKPPMETAEKIIGEIQKVQRQVTHLIVVSNNVFEDGIAYEKTVMEYIQAMGRINQKLASMADRVVEVAAGIPITVKQEDSRICRF